MKAWFSPKLRQFPGLFSRRPCCPPSKTRDKTTSQDSRHPARKPQPSLWTICICKSLDVLGPI